MLLNKSSCIKGRNSNRSGRPPAPRPTPLVPETAALDDGPGPCEERLGRESGWSRRQASRAASASSVSGRYPYIHAQPEAAIAHELAVLDWLRMIVIIRDQCTFLRRSRFPPVLAEKMASSLKPRHGRCVD